MRRVEPNPKVVVIGGDFLSHHFARDVDGHTRVAAAAKAEMARIARTFSKAFPHAQFLITLGNNDDACGDYSTAPNTAYLAALARIWAPLVNRSGASPNFVREFSHAGYYTSRLPFTNGRGVVLNDVYWSFVYHGCGQGSGNVGAQQLVWFSRTLADSKTTNNVVLMHIPPGVDENSTLLARRFLIVPFLQGGTESEFERIVSSNVQRVSFILAGHLHQNEFRLVGGAPVLVIPALSPIYRNNPAFLRLQVRDDGTLQDYQQFAYMIGSDAWMQVVDFDRAFGVDAFTAASVRAIHDRLARDESLRETWSSAMVGGAPDLRATPQTWRAFWCAQTFSTSEYAACAGDQRRVVAFGVAVGLFIAIVLVGLVAIGLRLATQQRRA